MILNDEQRLLKNTIEEFLAAHAPVDALRKLRDTKDELGYSTELWQQLVEMGIPLTALPESAGGLGFGWLGMGAVMQACGRNLSASPLFASIVLGASILEAVANQSQHATLLEAVTSGELTLALALEESSHHAPSTCSTALTQTSQGYSLQGKKTFVLDGHSADKIIVLARASGDISETQGLVLVLVDKLQAGATIKRTLLMDSRNSATISFDNVAIGADQVIGEVGQAWKILTPALERGAACMAAEMLGGCEALFDRTIDYLKEREQFDVKIGSFQALQHRAALMYCELQSLRSAVGNALASIDNGAEDTAKQVSLAKTLANNCYKLISNEAVQMHGGMGVTDELDVGLFLKRARVCMQILGDSDFHEDRYATLCGY
ncbi:MAG: acyl-CoA dehydrogenase [Pseudomonadales bacterium]|nr:acyl-CoA dehydrogenase [Pseudomonadales bacterium]